jgi:hypothetical protein
MGPTASRLKPVRRCRGPFAGQLTGQRSTWTLSQRFAVKPELAGSEGTREVRFVLTAGNGEAPPYGMCVDPRMRR